MKVALVSLLLLVAGAGAFAPHTKSKAVRRAPPVRCTVKSLADVAAGNPLIAGAARTIEFTKKNLTPELAPPPSMAELEKYVKAAQEGGPEAEDVQTAGKLIYAVMCEQVTLYDQDQAGCMTPSSIDYTDPSSFQDDEAFKSRLKYVYNYGITMLGQGLISEGDLKEAVLGRLAAKCGKEGKDFDDWLEMA
mmetsp:Transcript_41867/g.111539  ORF Transcript_41867/g.111539 Transcript_41867/m.111539 type:complete len:191 (-) Transcript_41867:120-692(-)|eukprot:CAMPEP_0119516784 /NCGR_PEP_ID=MMETSP1344-20130328/33883_1 /TAXON_ID=236787 /ORGANISM="Florenciella parvula, Strain CCMP2471" /LENGTH=190 /DNA_ID=CAMNT_0007554319 /DNA_START=22 /DNA_END=594 /DNA_ORIENTATION=-